RPEPTSVEAAGRPSFLGPGGGVDRPVGPMEQVQKPVDPFETERKKRDFESLYAGNVVVSFRGGETARRGEIPRRSADGAPVMPTTDEVAASVVRAFGGGASLPSALPPSVPSAAPDRSSTPPGGRGRSGREADRETPDETPPID